jgi:hypothetical protein
MRNNSNVALNTSAEGVIHGSITVLETGLFASLSDLVHGSKQWILHGVEIGSVNPVFNAIAGLFVLESITRAYRALTAKNVHRGLVAETLQRLSASSLIAFVVFGADLVPAIGAFAPYVFAGVIFSNAVMAGVQAMRYRLKASRLRAQLLSFNTDAIKNLNPAEVEQRLQELSPTYSRFKRQANQRVWEAARGLMTAAAVTTILILGATTGPVVGAVMGAVTAVFIASFIKSIVYRKKPAPVPLIPNDTNSNDSEPSNKALECYDNRTYKVTGFDHKVDYVRYLRDSSGDKKDMLLEILGDQRTKYADKAKISEESFVLFRNDALRKKERMITEIIDGLSDNSCPFSREALDTIYRNHQGSLFSRGALSSFNRRFGGMQSLLEAVEWYVASSEVTSVVRRKYADR